MSTKYWWYRYNICRQYDIQIYDVKKCFDKLWFSETANDLFKVGVQDDQFVTIVNANKDCEIAVKMPWGTVSERKNVIKKSKMSLMRWCHWIDFGFPHWSRDSFNYSKND